MTEPPADPALQVEEVVATPARLPSRTEHVLGRSREGRPISGWCFGEGTLRVSLVAGCHADEPVGPETLRRLAAWLAGREAGHPALSQLSWYLVPDANPDGAARNASWSGAFRDTPDARGERDRGFDLAAYAVGAVRELPGDDVEFGFPRGPGDTEARPENRALAAFLARGAPFHLHASLHGMAFAPGPWFLMEASWIGRTEEMRTALRRRVRELGYELLDWDRRGEKGFRRIEEGFSTRPDSHAMHSYFAARGDLETATRFRPSSMEHVRRLSEDPLTLVSEMPLFLVPRQPAFPFALLGDGREAFREWLSGLTAAHDAEGVHRRAAELGLRPMPLRDQMRLQLHLVAEGLAAVRSAS